jgi:hypothetical protein
VRARARAAVERPLACATPEETSAPVSHARLTRHLCVYFLLCWNISLMTGGGPSGQGRVPGRAALVQHQGERSHQRQDLYYCIITWYYYYYYYYIVISMRVRGACTRGNGAFSTRPVSVRYTYICAHCMHTSAARQAAMDIGVSLVVQEKPRRDHACAPSICDSCV